MMKRTIIFGAGGMGREIFEEIKDKKKVVAFWDNSDCGGQVMGIQVRKPSFRFFTENHIEEVILGACYPSMREQLLEMGIDEDRINTVYADMRVYPRIHFLKNFAELMSKISRQGACAEAGVFQGEFAQYINRFFPDRILYLFDTFEGFPETDVEIEKKQLFSNAKIGQYCATSEEVVMGKMDYPENCRLLKGYFPDTAAAVEDRFCFVSLDMDLYKPTLDGLDFFCDRMVKGGVILVHDYFSHYRGVMKAVHEFMERHETLIMLPIGDEISIAVAGF